MADPYWRYAAPTDPASIGRVSFPGYIPAESASTLTTQYHSWNSNHMQPTSSDYMQKEGLASRPGAYSSAGELAGFGGNIKGYSSHVLEDPAFITQRNNLGLTHAVADILNERPSSIRPVDVSSGASAAESNVLFVDGLPNDCTRREVGHLFRPFIGFREIRVVHREPRRNGDKAMVLCFVEFTDAKCALTALEALQGYKFDNKKPESPLLKIHFAHFPFRLPADRPS